MESDALDLRGIFDLLRRRLWIILLATALCLALAGLALVVLKPVYSATALVLVDPSKKNLLDPDQQLTGSSLDALRVDSEVELVKSEATLLAVAGQMDLATDPEFGLRPRLGDMLLALFGVHSAPSTGDQALTAVMDNLRDAVAVQRRGHTFLIAVTARSARPDFAARLANTLARTYIDHQLQAKIASTLDSARALEDRVAEASATVARSEGAPNPFVDQVARAQYQTLLTRQKELDTQAYLQVADSRIASEATVPQTPSFPNPRLVLLLAGLAGLGIGIGLALLIEHFVGGVTSSAQAEALLRTPVASALPRPPRRNGESIADLLVTAPLSPFSESIRRARIGIDQAVRKRRSGAPEGGIVIAIASAAPNEGKTTVALSLARAYALAGMSTLLIDCDLRQPGIHRELGFQASEGLLEYLAGNGTADLKSVIAVDPGSGAKVIVGARRSDIATDQLVAGRTFARLIAAARQNFDIVVLDTPPLGPVVDGLYLAGMADAIAFVVKFSKTPQQEVKAAMAALVGAKGEDVPILTILNQQTTHPAARRGKYAGYYAEA